MTPSQLPAETARSLEAVASAIHRLGNADAGTQMGAIENLAKELGDGLACISASLDSVSEALEHIATVLDQKP